MLQVTSYKHYKLSYRNIYYTILYSLFIRKGCNSSNNRRGMRVSKVGVALQQCYIWSHKLQTESSEYSDNSII